MSTLRPDIDDEPRIPTGFEDVPDWAFDYIRAALVMDQQVGEIETGLMSKGLSLKQAAHAIYHFFEYQLQEEKRLARRARRLRWFSRCASLVVASIYVSLAY